MPLFIKKIYIVEEWTSVSHHFSPCRILCWKICLKHLFISNMVMDGNQLWVILLPVEGMLKNFVGESWLYMILYHRWAFLVGWKVVVKVLFGMLSLKFLLEYRKWFKRSWTTNHYVLRTRVFFISELWPVAHLRSFNQLALQLLLLTTIYGHMPFCGCSWFFQKKHEKIKMWRQGKHSSIWLRDKETTLLY